jgi:hypothetical protein
VGRIYGPKRDEVEGSWRRLHNEEFHKLYASQNVIWVIKSKLREVRNAYEMLVGKSDGN